MTQDTWKKQQDLDAIHDLVEKLKRSPTTVATKAIRIMDILNARTPEQVHSATAYAETQGLTWKDWAPWALSEGHVVAWEEALRKGADVQQVLKSHDILLIHRSNIGSPRETSPSGLWSLLSARCDDALPLLLKAGLSPYTSLTLSQEEAKRLPSALHKVPWWIAACCIGSGKSVKTLYDAVHSHKNEEQERALGGTWHDWALYVLACRHRRGDMRPFNNPSSGNVRRESQGRWAWWKRFCKEGGDPCALLPVSMSERPLEKNEIWQWLQDALLPSRPIPSERKSTPLHALVCDNVFDYAWVHDTRNTRLCAELVNAALKKYKKGVLTQPSADKLSWFLPHDSQGEDPLRATYGWKSKGAAECDMRRWLWQHHPEAMKQEGWKDVVRDLDSNDFSFALVTTQDVKDKALKLMKDYCIVQGTFPPIAAIAALKLQTESALNKSSRWLLKSNNQPDMEKLYQHIKALHEIFEEWVDTTPSPAYTNWCGWSATLLTSLEKILQRENDPAFTEGLTPEARERMRYEGREGLKLALILPNPSSCQKETKIDSSRIRPRV